MGPVRSANPTHQVGRRHCLPTGEDLSATPVAAGKGFRTTDRRRLRVSVHPSRVFGLPLVVAGHQPNSLSSARFARSSSLMIVTSCAAAPKRYPPIGNHKPVHLAIDLNKVLAGRDANRVISARHRQPFCDLVALLDRLARCPLRIQSSVSLCSTPARSGCQRRSARKQRPPQTDFAIGGRRLLAEWCKPSGATDRRVCPA